MQYCNECKQHVSHTLFRSASSTLCFPCLEALGAVHDATLAPPPVRGSNQHIAARAAGGLPVPDVRPHAGRRKKRKARKAQRYQQSAESRAFLKSQEWRRLRMEAFVKYGNRCKCCGRGPADGAIMNVDHVLPRKTHPHLALDINNLSVLCGTCNAGKGNRTYDFR